MNVTFSRIDFCHEKTFLSQYCYVNIIGSFLFVIIKSFSKVDRYNQTTIICSKVISTTSSKMAEATNGYAGDKKITFININAGNNPSRIRFLIYYKGLEDKFDIKTPDDIGGWGSKEFKKVNPQGKLPIIILEDGFEVFESRVISNYIADRFRDVGPDVIAPTAKQRALVAMINQIHDLYIASPNSSHKTVTATQACMYKPVEQIDGPSRAIKVYEVNKQLNVLEGLIVGPYCVGDQVTEADFAMYPTFIFFQKLMPLVFGWGCVFENRPKLKAWWHKVDELDAAKRVKAEVTEALEG